MYFFGQSVGPLSLVKRIIVFLMYRKSENRRITFKNKCGPIALVRDGDKIRVDLSDRSLDLMVDASELVKRRQAWRRPDRKFTRGWLARYQSMVTSAAHGAVLEPPAEA